MSKGLGQHILIEYYDCKKEKIISFKDIECYMNKAAKLSGATIVDSVFHNFNPYGVSGAVIIQESHLTIHTWPEYNYAAVDIFTCGDNIKPMIAFNYLQEEFGASQVEFKEVIRGEIRKIKEQ